MKKIENATKRPYIDKPGNTKLKSAEQYTIGMKSEVFRIHNLN